MDNLHDQLKRLGITDFRALSTWLAAHELTPCSVLKDSFGITPFSGTSNDHTVSYWNRF